MKEQQLYDWLKENKYPDLEATTGYATWDCYSRGSKLTIELKSRNTHYDTLMIEKKKYDRLLLMAAEYENDPLYVNSTPKGIWSFPLLSSTIEWTKMMLPITTEFNNREKILKEVGFLTCNEDNCLLLF
jgi:hypothetical protein